MLGVNKQMINRYCVRQPNPLPELRDALIGKTKHYDSHEVIIWFAKNVVCPERAAKPEKQPTELESVKVNHYDIKCEMDLQRANLARAQMEGHDLKNAKEKGELVPMVMVTNAIVELSTLMKSRLMGLTPALKQRANITDKVAGMIDKEIRDCLNDISEIRF